MKKSQITFFSLVLMCASANAQNEDYDTCQVTYKACTSNFMDQYEPYINTYEHDPEECNNNIKEWTKLEYEFVHCQDDYNSCKGNDVSLWERIHSAPDISLSAENPASNGLSKIHIQDISEEAETIRNLKSLLIARNGKLIFEDNYEFNENPEPHHIFSITKSITSLLIGIAIDQDYLESEEILIKPFFKEYYKGKHDARKDKITIRHLLTMSSTINFSDNNNWYDPANYWKYSRDDNAHDWVLNKKMLLNYEPGDQWLYGTPNIDLLSSILASATDMTVIEFAEKNLFKPLGINKYIWAHDSAENYYGGFTLYLRPHALMRIGQMVLDGGVYDGNRVVSEEWLQKSLYNQFPLGGEESWEYGYLWWRFRVGDYQVISALGWGGQQITLVPSLDLIVITTANAHLCSRKEQDDQFNEIMDLAKSIILSIDKKE
ncbi:MAG: serine hydrolase [Gammaproteobacteria bacterium]|nr:MAG: serine hydrolase [Gammaproteobacteria bacterium]